MSGRVKGSIQVLQGNLKPISSAEVTVTLSDGTSRSGQAGDKGFLFCAIANDLIKVKVQAATYKDYETTITAPDSDFKYVVVMRTDGRHAWYFAKYTTLEDPCYCTVGIRIPVGASTSKNDITAKLVSLNLIHLPGSAVIDVAGAQYTIEGGTYIDIPGAQLGAFDLSDTGACIDIQPGAGSIPAPAPAPAPATGPQLEECTFPTLSWNLISVLSALIEWIGCILHNIITILQWVVDWFLHFPDHLDQWISRLFGVDPALPFWDELEKKLIKMLISAAKQVIDILFADSDYWKGKKYQR